MLVLFCVEVFDRMLADGTFAKLLHTLHLDLSTSSSQSVRASSNCMQSSISAAAASICDCSNGIYATIYYLVPAVGQDRSVSHQQLRVLRGHCQL